MNQHELAPDVCPVCGADVPDGARACPECGADEKTGWDADATRGDGLDLPDETFDREEFARREWGDGEPTARSSRGKWLTAAVLAILLIAWLLSPLWR